MVEEQKTKRYNLLKKEIEESISLPSVIRALSMGFYPANYKMLEAMVQEFFTLEAEKNNGN